MPVYEISTDNALLGTEALVRHLCGDEGFSDSTHPTSLEVTQFQNMAYYKIAASLANAGFSPTQTDNEVLGFLEALQVLETVILIEQAYPVNGAGEENERFVSFTNQAKAFYSLMAGDALTVLGATQLTTRALNIKATGVSYDEKNTVETNTDFIPHRFKRNMHSSVPAATTTSQREQ